MYKLLDLFCGAGGASYGYHLAGFDVTGVDIHHQSRYPFKFIQGNALEFPLDEFDVIHASPPCQFYSIAAKSYKNKGKVYEDLIEPIRNKLISSGKPYIIENVPKAPLRADYILCGSHFGLRLVRHRLFEVSWGPIFKLMPPCSHDANIICVFGSGTPQWLRNKRRKLGLHPNVNVDEWREVMEMPWAIRKEISQAIPPKYTEFMGKELLNYLKKEISK